MTTKIDYIRLNMRMAAFGRTADAIIASIPDTLIETLTPAQLVQVADALHAAHQEGKAQAERDVLAEGAIYSPDQGRMLELQ
jgi:hypothetical protein